VLSMGTALHAAFALRSNGSAMPDQ
jgi:hypothetical protein